MSCLNWPPEDALLFALFEECPSGSSSQQLSFLIRKKLDDDDPMPKAGKFFLARRPAEDFQVCTGYSFNLSFQK